MSDIASLSLPEAARRLGVRVRVLRSAIRAGKIPAPPALGATAALPPEWVADVQAMVVTSPKLFSSVARQKVRPFARYEGTSAWRKYRSRVREYNQFHASEKAA